MYKDKLNISRLVTKCFGVTNTSVQNFAIRISSVKTVPKCLRKLKVFFNKFNIDVSSLLMSSLRAIVICQKYFGNHVISSQIHLFAPLLDMRRCTVCLYSRWQRSISTNKNQISESTCFIGNIHIHQRLHIFNNVPFLYWSILLIILTTVRCYNCPSYGPCLHRSIGVASAPVVGDLYSNLAIAQRTKVQCNIENLYNK